MSLYTPVFPSFHESTTARKGRLESTLAAPIGKQESYVEFLRDIHLFLSTQNDMLSPPSRPSSPRFDRRVEKVRDEIKSVINATQGETSSGKWTRINQTLKLGCVRGRHWSVSGAGPSPPEEDPKWILPDEESEWIEWEEKMEESRRLKRKTNVSQQMDTTISTAPDSPNISQANFAKQLTRAYNSARERRPRDVSPTTLRAAKEKVKKWQASMGAEVWHNTGSSPASTSARAVVAGETGAKGKTEKPQQGGRALDFAIVKPAARSIIDKRGKGSLSRPTARGGSAPVRSHELKSSTPSKAIDVPEAKTPIDNDQGGSKQLPEAMPMKDDMPKIADIPETPFLPPSFPAHLETSTPLPDSAMIIRAKPSLILPIPALSSTLLPSDPPDGCQPSLAEPHAAKVSSSLPPQPPQIDIMQPRKRSRALSPSLHSTSNDPRPVTPPAKRLRAPSQSRSTPRSERSKAMSPNGALDKRASVRDEARGPNVGSTASHREKVDTVGMTSGVPSTPGRNDGSSARMDPQGIPEKIPSPTKSVRSHFSAPDSEAADSPLRANLLLESPVSPMLSYAQNPSSFLPQITSTQVGRESPTAARTNQHMFGMGFSSQFDVERRMDRVSEMLEKDVDFDGWLRDARAVETTGD